MREFDSSGLRELARVLQISSGSPQLVELQDEIIQQGIDLNDFLRRGVTPADSLGLYSGSINNVHLGSDTISTEVDPYAPGTAFVGNGYPPVIDSSLDVWLLGANALNVTSPGDFGGGNITLIMSANGMGWRNGFGSSIAVQQNLLSFNAELTMGNRLMLGITGIGGMLYNTPTRIRRGGQNLRFETVKSGAGAGSYRADFTLGVFPAGMGQDGI